MMMHDHSPLSLELMRLLGGGMDNPELENLTIGSFMQRFGEDIDSRTNDGSIDEFFEAFSLICSIVSDRYKYDQ